MLRGPNDNGKYLNRKVSTLKRNQTVVLLSIASFAWEEFWSQRWSSGWCRSSLPIAFGSNLFCSVGLREQVAPSFRLKDKQNCTAVPTLPMEDRHATHTGCSWWQVWRICLFPSAGLPHATERDWEVGCIHCAGSGRLVGLYHRTHCVECGVESDSFSFGRLHVGVIHWVLERRLAIGALVANVAIELDLRPCPAERRWERCKATFKRTWRQRKYDKKEASAEWQVPVNRF